MLDRRNSPRLICLPSQRRPDPDSMASKVRAGYDNDFEGARYAHSEG